MVKGETLAGGKRKENLKLVNVYKDLKDTQGEDSNVKNADRRGRLEKRYSSAEIV